MVKATVCNIFDAFLSHNKLLSYNYLYLLHFLKIVLCDLTMIHQNN